MGRTCGIVTLVAAQNDRCQAAEDGAPCTAEARVRGFCLRHYVAGREQGVIERVRAASGYTRKHDIRLKEPGQLEPGICRVIVNGQPCPVPAARRGLCDRHYAAIWQRPDLRLDDFAAPSVKAGDFKLRCPVVPGVCRVSERGIACNGIPHARGICKNHYHWLREHEPDLFERLAERDRSMVVYTLRARLKPGRCRVAENGQACGQKEWARGMCEHHYAVISHKPEVFAKISAPTKHKPAAVFQRKAVAEPGTCHILENGVGCTAPAEYRGLCLRHYKKIRGNRKCQLTDFLLPKAEPVYSLKPLAQLNRAMCRVVEYGEPCQESAFGRGLCRRHYRVLQEAGRVGEFGAAPRKAGGLNRLVPHAYLDKNILFDWCDAEAFGGKGQQASWELVERVRAGKMVATISGSAVTSAYNHVRYRASRPATEGGGGTDEKSAEGLARNTLRRMLEGTWRILSLAARDLRMVLATAGEAQSYEDALEWAAYQQARQTHHGPRWFVTRDEDFPEGMRPWTVEEHLKGEERR